MSQGNISSLHRTKRRNEHTPVGGDICIEGGWSQPEKILAKEASEGKQLVRRNDCMSGIGRGSYIISPDSLTSDHGGGAKEDVTCLRSTMRMSL